MDLSRPAQAFAKGAFAFAVSVAMVACLAASVPPPNSGAIALFWMLFVGIATFREVYGSFR